MERLVCPRCGRDSVILGLVGLTNPWACLACGLAWTEVDPTQLRAAVRRDGDKSARQLLDEVDPDSMRGLPVAALARQVAAHVAEIDHLIQSSPANLVVRRYRELTGAPWDEAITTTWGWCQMTRAEKLARLGWAGKKPKGLIDDLADPLV